MLGLAPYEYTGTRVAGLLKGTIRHRSVSITKNWSRKTERRREASGIYSQELNECMAKATFICQRDGWTPLN